MAGIYIHIPFCKRKCTYCDFHFSTTYEKYKSNMLDSMFLELELRKDELNGIVETIYFGGGTPSLLFANELELFLNKISELHQIKTDIEITLEANPDDITAESIQAWKRIGINRLSIGLQSFDDEDLIWMNRAHTAKESVKAVEISKKNGIENISIDLMYGLPNMDLNRWEKQIDLAINLGVKHISAYCLTVEEKTVLHKLVKSKKILPASNEMQSKHFSLLQRKLNKAGFKQYEVSNFGKENFFSEHNSSYWKGKIYQGIGPSAHSFFINKRSWNISNNMKYIEAIQKKILPSNTEILTKKDQFNEALLIGLRTIWGVSLEKLNSYGFISKNFHKKIDELVKEKKAYLENNHLILTSEGLLFADNIAMDLFLD